ncbi:unnamed protein product [Pedinophyceae sp. YPF-701]|nr:unnamed protein product [Pedinophyceae sp. YPF-701]
MFSLIYGLLEYLLRKTEIHLLILGIDNAGKTTLLERIKHEYLGSTPAAQTVPTVGLNIGRIELGRKHMLFWDLGGAASLRGIWRKYLQEAHAVLFVVDSADPSRFPEARQALSSAMASPHLLGKPVMVLANKGDLPHAAAPLEVLSALGLSGERGGLVECTSGHTGMNVKRSVDRLVAVVGGLRSAGAAL